MSSSEKTLLPDSERKASLRARASKFGNQGPLDSAPKFRESRNKVPGRPAKKIVASTPVDRPVETTPVAGIYRPLLPQPKNAAAPSETSDATGTTSTSSSRPAKKRKLNQTPPVSLLSIVSASIPSSAVSLAASAVENTTEAENQLVSTVISTPSVASPETYGTAFKPEYKDKYKALVEEPSNQPHNFEIHPSNISTSSGEESEELSDEMCVICAGNNEDYAKYTFTKTNFEAIFEKAPYFKTYLATPDSTSINITDFLGSSLKVLIPWITNGFLMDLDPRKLGRRRGLCNYPFAETYTMANTFGLLSMCDEMMDSALKVLWGRPDEHAIPPDIRDLYIVYSRTKPGNPLRKLYIAIFHWNISSEECNRLIDTPEISSPELWDLLKGSGHAGVDYLNYARNQITDRAVFHPIEPHRWGPCELHQHPINQHCPLKESRKDAADCRIC